MALRFVRILGALVLLMVGGVVAYFAISIPNDVQAGSLLKKARAGLQKGEKENAREALEQIVRDYPRTDAAAAATQTLFRMVDQDRGTLTDHVKQLTRERELDRARIAALEKKLIELAAKPPAPVVVAKPLAPKPTVAKKSPTIRRTPTKRRRP